MGRKRGRPAKKQKKEEGRESLLREETKNSVIAIVLFGVTTLLALASIEKAGPAGAMLYGTFTQVLGIGYYILPSLAFVIALFLLLAPQKKFLSVTFVGAGLFLISGLGLIDIIATGKGGIIGNVIGGVELFVGYTAALVVTATFLLASVLIMLNVPLRFTGLLKAETDDEEDDEKVDVPETPMKEKIITPPMPDEDEDELDEEIIESAPAFPAPDIQLRPAAMKKTFGNYTPPPISLLKSSIEKPAAGDLRASANIIKRTLDSFGIPVEMGEINIGPKVTRYTLKPAEGVKLARITALNQDLSLALAAHPIRIEAPIPGKSFVGIEVPNRSAAIVRLGSMIAYEDFQKSGPMHIVLGRDVTGEPILANIETMPHLLIAGSTGSGKSVTIHALIISLLYKNSPETLKMALIDPKRVELTAYNGIPHLVSPVITDAKKTVGVFRWAIQEMERRYEILQDAGARDLKSYNKSHQEVLPYIVIVVDELADIMFAYGREVESSIVRLAQMARATGIHLILSTQRPSVEVVTGLIKANITNRVALQVGSQVDSRTILDSAGAEKLLGGGDMLFLSNELSKPKRIQGAYVSEDEIHAVAKFLKNNAGEHGEDVPEFDDAVPTPDFNILADEGESDDDDLYPEAVQMVRQTQKASASFLQRRFKIGYARAARLLDIMEAKGVVGPGEGAKPREVYGEADAEL